MNWEEFWTLFHLAWGQATRSPEYDKKVWKDMQRMLTAKESGNESEYLCGRDDRQG